MASPSKKRPAALFFYVAIISCLVFCTHAGYGPYEKGAGKWPISDHFNGELFFNPGSPPSSDAPQRRTIWWLWRFINEPKWEQIQENTPGEAPIPSVPKGSLVITPIGHATFLIQLDGLNILTDPIWSNRCSPIPWAGPIRHRLPGIRFEDLPTIDAILISHNHYDHLDIPTLKRLAKKGVKRSITTLGNRVLIRSSGIPSVDELDWWQSVRLSNDVTVTVVPAQHFSSRSLWDRNKTLWGGFVISAASGNIYFAGDTGYGPHFREIARRFSPVHVALLPISPFWPQNINEPHSRQFNKVHMGPAEAVQVHIELGAKISIAAHFQVFQLGVDKFDDAPVELEAALRERGLAPDVFIAPIPGQKFDLTPKFGLANLKTAVGNRLR